MGSNDLLIKISADAKNAEKAFDDIKDQTGDLENQLAKVATISGIAFAAFTAEIYLADAAFREAQKSSIQLTNALQNQGIYTAELEKTYKDYANVVQAQTGIDNDAVISAQAIAQTYLGQTKITQELTNSIADLGAKMDGDLNGAAEKIGRTIGTGTNAFAKQGLVISETATEAERFAKVLEFVQAKAGGLAVDMANADGNVQRLKTSFGNAQEAIGERFAPVLAAARGLISKFFETFDKYPIIADMAAALLAAGVVVTGLITALALGIPAFTTLSAAVAAFGISLNVAFVGIPLLIGAVVASVAFLALNWTETMQVMRTALAGLITFTDEAFTGLAKIIAGAVTLDTAQIDEGVKQLKNSYSKATEVAAEYYREQDQLRVEDTLKQDAGKKAQADKEAAQEKQHQANLRNIKAEERELLKLQNEFASEELIALKTKEIETLKALDAETNEATKALYLERLEIVREQEALKQVEELERVVAFNQLLQETKNELALNNITVEAEIGAQRLAMIQAQAKTEADIERDVQAEILKTRVNAYNQKLLDAKKYGETFAALNKILHSDEVKGVKTAADELIKMQSSKSQELRGIAKAAALVQIAISTAESAMNVYRGFSTIPIIGPALGVAGAFAAVAFGAERAGDVLRAADGGLVEGGIAGRDSVPAMLMPGELVVPRRSFSDVVGAVQDKADGGGSEAVLEQLKMLNSNLKNKGDNHFYGDVSTDDSYVDNFVKKISDSLEFRNTKIVGVNA